MFALNKTNASFPKLPSHIKEGSSQRKVQYVLAQQREEMLAKQKAEAAKKKIYYDYRTKVPWNPNSSPSCSVSVNSVAVDANRVPSVKGSRLQKTTRQFSWLMFSTQFTRPRCLNNMATLAV
jgi:hypothetical protein